jgi:hypothetical protein
VRRPPRRARRASEALCRRSGFAGHQASNFRGETNRPLVPRRSTLVSHRRGRLPGMANRSSGGTTAGGSSMPAGLSGVQGLLFAGRESFGPVVDSDAPPIRVLGSRGSRDVHAAEHADVGAPRAVLEVLAGVPGWWRNRARAAGLDGRWCQIEHGLSARPPFELPNSEPGRWRDGFELGEAYLAALSKDVRARHGRHYTPRQLAEELWRMARRALGIHEAAAPLRGLVRDPSAGAGALLLPPLSEHLEATRDLPARDVLGGLSDVIDGVDSTRTRSLYGSPTSCSERCACRFSLQHPEDSDGRCRLWFEKVTGSLRLRPTPSSWS